MCGETQQKSHDETMVHVMHIKPTLSYTPVPNNSLFLSLQDVNSGLRFKRSGLLYMPYSFFKNFSIPQIVSVERVNRRHCVMLLLRNNHYQKDCASYYSRCLYRNQSGEKSMLFILIPYYFYN